jgi:hypothetical protein
MTRVWAAFTTWRKTEISILVRAARIFATMAVAAWPGKLGTRNVTFTCHLLGLFLQNVSHSLARVLDNAQEKVRTKICSRVGSHS